MIEALDLREIIVDGIRPAYVIILVFFVFLNSFYALLLIMSIPELWAHSQLADDDQLRRDYILKPLNLRVLMAKIPGWIERAEQGL